MGIYQTEQGWGVDYRDEFGRRTRKFVGSQEAALALDAGASISECMALRASSYDRIEHTLFIRGTKRHRDRLLPLTDRLDAALRQHTRAMMSDALLFTRAGQKIKVGGQFLGNLRRKRHHPSKFHHLRHTFATRLAAVAQNQLLVIHALGHGLTTVAFTAQGKTVATTGQYVPPSLEELRAAIDLMDAARQKGEQTP